MTGLDEEKLKELFSKIERETQFYQLEAEMRHLFDNGSLQKAFELALNPTSSEDLLYLSMKTFHAIAINLDYRNKLRTSSRFVAKISTILKGRNLQKDEEVTKNI